MKVSNIWNLLGATLVVAIVALSVKNASGTSSIISSLSNGWSGILGAAQSGS
jgi:hypothetical protein